MDIELSGKLPGKTKYSGRRRTATRRAGFISHPDSTGGDFKISDQSTILLAAGESIVVSFSVPEHQVADVVAFGGWYIAPESVAVTIEGSPFSRKTLVPPCAPNWSKFGSMWASQSGQPFTVKITFTAAKAADIAFYELGCGVLQHKHLDGARPELMRNMYQFSPEAHFFGVDGDVVVDAPEAEGKYVRLCLKSCNRCAGSV
jgi:hypothetical protein